MAWTVWSCDTTTGAKLAKLPCASFSWQRVLNSGGTGQAVFKLADEAFREIDMHDRVDLVRRTLSFEWDDEPVAGGLVTRHNWDADTKTLTVNHADLWWLLARRFLTVQNTTGVEKTKLELLNWSVSTIVKKVVQTGTSDLPMTYWSDFTGSRKKTYDGFALPIVGDELAKLIDQPDGPDVDFRLINGGNGVQWQMRNNEGFGTYAWNMSAAQSGISGLNVITDAEKLANNVFAVGKGTEQDSIIRAASSPSTYPLLQTAEAHKDEGDVAVLDGFVSEALRIHASPTSQWSFNMLAGGGNGPELEQTKVTDLRLNGQLSLWTNGDEWIPPGWHTHRLIRYSGDHKQSVKLEFQPTGGA
jgi:hypothetical protein